MGGAVDSYEAGLVLAQANLDNGKALGYFKAMVAAQGGDVSYVDDLTKFGEVSVCVCVCVRVCGHVQECIWLLPKAATCRMSTI
jgi:pyrimidine-nucleoside phosphorylase